MPTDLDRGVPLRGCGRRRLAAIPLHTHTSDLRIVVLKGAYVFKPEHGAATRVAAGQYLFIPGGDRHVSEGDAKEGAVFYQESAGKFDLNPVK